jgi:hypothetical protein
MSGEVFDERVELGVGRRRQATVETLLKLVARQPTLQMLLAENAGDRLTLVVADPQATITWPSSAGVALTAHV